MSRAKRIVLGLSVVILTAGWSCAGKGEEASALARLVETHADDARSAATKFDDILASVRAASAERLTMATTRIEEAVAAAHVPPEIKEAFGALTFDATCAVVFGNASLDSAEELAAWMTHWAVLYGISFLPGGASDQAGRVLDSVDSEQAWTDAQEICSQTGGIVRGWS